MKMLMKGLTEMCFNNFKIKLNVNKEMCRMKLKCAKNVLFFEIKKNCNKNKKIQNITRNVVKP